MTTLKENIDKRFGQHKVYTYDATKHPFIDYFTRLYETTNFNDIAKNIDTLRYI